MLFKKNREELAKEKQANEADDVLQELDGDAMQEISGGANPFASLPRQENQSIDDDLRSNG